MHGAKGGHSDVWVEPVEIDLAAVLVRSLLMQSGLSLSTETIHTNVEEVGFDISHECISTAADVMCECGILIKIDAGGGTVAFAYKE